MILEVFRHQFLLYVILCIYIKGKHQQNTSIKVFINLFHIHGPFLMNHFLIPSLWYILLQSLPYRHGDEVLNKKLIIFYILFGNFSFIIPWSSFQVVIVHYHHFNSFSNNIEHLGLELETREIPKSKKRRNITHEVWSI